MNAYKEMKERQQKEVNAFPLGFAFGQDQFNEMMKKWGLCHGRDGKPTDNDYSKIYSIGCGGYVRKEDYDSMNEMFKRHHKEIEDAIAADQEGTGFVCDMFEYEMWNHEYGYTWDPDDTLAACGMNMDMVCKNKNLLNGWVEAEHRVRSWKDD